MKNKEEEAEEGEVLPAAIVVALHSYYVNGRGNYCISVQLQTTDPFQAQNIEYMHVVHTHSNIFAPLYHITHLTKYSSKRSKPLIQCRLHLSQTVNAAPGNTHAKYCWPKWRWKIFPQLISIIEIRK